MTWESKCQKQVNLRFHPKPILNFCRLRNVIQSIFLFINSFIRRSGFIRHRLRRSGRFRLQRSRQRRSFQRCRRWSVCVPTGSFKSNITISDLHKCQNYQFMGFICGTLANELWKPLRLKNSVIETRTDVGK